MSDMAVAYEPRRITVEEYHRMYDEGILDPDERTELLDGEIVVVSKAGRRHKATVDRLTMLLAPRFAGRAIVRVQSGVIISEISEPEPDVALLAPDPGEYFDREAAPADVLLLIEVGDTTRFADRRVKAPLYARCGLRELWLVDVVQRVVRVYREPRDGEYGSVFQARGGNRLAPAAFPDDTLAVDELLGPPARPDA